MSDFRWIPLLSPKPFERFTPAEFKAYVVSLKQEKEAQAARAKKAPPKEVTWSISKKNVLSVRIKRDPKEVTQEEIQLISESTGRPVEFLTEYLLGGKKPRAKLRMTPSS